MDKNFLTLTWVYTLRIPTLIKMPDGESEFIANVFGV